MKKTYHLCLSAGNEIMFRDLEDYNRGFNCFALALYKSCSTGLVESFMSNHCHMIVQSERPADLIYNFRLSYTMYFNRKYFRTGRLGEKRHFTMDVVGYHHTLAALSYVLRNSLHHGISPIPYSYPHSTVNSIFLQEMGKQPCENILSPKHYRRFVNKSSEIPDNYIMSESGVFLRDSVLDIPQVEALYVTPRAFNWYMTRKSSEEWESEQRKDKIDRSPINLSTIEKGVSIDTLEKMLIHENGKSDYRKLSDIDVCTIIDRILVPEFAMSSVYQLTPDQKIQIANFLHHNHKLNESQIRRCLAM